MAPSRPSTQSSSMRCARRASSSISSSWRTASKRWCGWCSRSYGSRSTFFTRKKGLISISVGQALEQPLNYAHNYLDEILEPCVNRVIYLDSDLVVVDDIAKLWWTELGKRTVGVLEYCHANFTKYFTDKFWADLRLSSTFDRIQYPIPSSSTVIRYRSCTVNIQYRTYFPQ